MNNFAGLLESIAASYPEHLESDIIAIPVEELIYIPSEPLDDIDSNELWQLETHEIVWDLVRSLYGSPESWIGDVND